MEPLHFHRSNVNAHCADHIHSSKPAIAISLVRTEILDAETSYPKAREAGIPSIGMFFNERSMPDELTVAGRTGVRRTETE